MLTHIILLDDRAAASLKSKLENLAKQRNLQFVHLRKSSQLKELLSGETVGKNQALLVSDICLGPFDHIIVDFLANRKMSKLLRDKIFSFLLYTGDPVAVGEPIDPRISEFEGMYLGTYNSEQHEEILRAVRESMTVDGE